MNIIHTLLHYGYAAFVRIKELIKLPFERELYRGECYYPEYSECRQNNLAVFCAQSVNILRYGKPNKFYFMYGFDIKGLRNKKEYVDYTRFMKQRSRLNNRAGLMSAVPILRNKDLFGIVADAYSIPVPKNIGTVSDGKIFLYESQREVDIDKFLKENNIDAFAKKIDGECADGVFSVKSDGGQVLVDNKVVDKLSDKVSGGIFLLQKRLSNQHSDINKIYPLSVNTIRLITVTNPKTGIPEVMTAVLRVGASGNHVDNWAVGGLSIGIDISTGKLAKYGFYKPGFGTKTDRHPDTGVVFEGLKIPYFKEASDMALEFHRRLRNIHSVGWDISVTEDGPCFIEGNDNWEISLLQVSNHGYRKDFDRLFS